MSLQLKRQKLVKKVEVQPDQVTIYLDQVRRGTGMGAEPQCWGVGLLPCHGWWHLTLGPSPQLMKEEETFAFTATQDFPVRNLQPATVTLYDYYETGEPGQRRGPGVPGPAATPCDPNGSEGGWPSCQFTLTSLGSLTGAAHPEPLGHRPSRCR